MMRYLVKIFFSGAVVLLLALLLSGCSLRAPIKHIELADNKVVPIDTREYHTQLFQKSINTKGYKTLRIFAHIYNEDYSGKPIQKSANFQIIAYYAIGQGGWGYHSKVFNYESTSGWSGVLDIPVVGEVTRVGIYAAKMPDTSLKVDVVASFLN